METITAEGDIEERVEKKKLSSEISTLLALQAAQLQFDGLVHFKVPNVLANSTFTKEFVDAVEEVESRGYMVQWAPSLDEVGTTAVWLQFAGTGWQKSSAKAALGSYFNQSGLKCLTSLALHIGGAADQVGLFVPSIAAYAQGERRRPETGCDWARHPRLVVEIDWLEDAHIALSKVTTYLSDVFYGPEGTRVMEVWVVLIPKVCPPHPAAGPAAGPAVGPLIPFEGALPDGVVMGPTAVVVYFSKQNMLYQPAYAPVLWDHLVQVPAGSLGGDAFPANDFLNETYDGKLLWYIARLVLPDLCWAELSHIISYLSLREIWKLGCCNRSAFITFLRERSLRKCVDYDKLPARFLSKWSQHEKLGLVSYPRSGNSLVRKLVESSTGIVTGSDNRPNRTLAASLLEFGYLGEAITDNSVWMVKSHYPERLGYIRFGVGRVVLVVRNPFDAIESYFHMGMTNTHDKALTREVFYSLKDTWTKFVANEASIWVEFHRFWMRKRFECPVLIVRYEDIMIDKEGTMAKISAFMLEKQPPLGLSRYTKHVNAQETSKSAGYEPKKVKKFGKGLDVMSDEDKTLVVETCGKLMTRFGYEVITEADPTSLDGTGRLVTGLRIQSEQEMSVALSHLDPVLNPSIFTVVTPTPKVLNKEDPLLPTPSPTPVALNTELFINDYFTIRTKEDLFGRNITDLRKGMTKGDTEPFATM